MARNSRRLRVAAVTPSVSCWIAGPAYALHLPAMTPSTARRSHVPVNRVTRPPSRTTRPLTACRAPGRRNDERVPTVALTWLHDMPCIHAVQLPPAWQLADAHHPKRGSMRCSFLLLLNWAPAPPARDRPQKRARHHAEARWCRTDRRIFRPRSCRRRPDRRCRPPRPPLRSWQ